METFEHIVDFEEGYPTFTLYPFGDVHVGAKACDEDAVKRFVKIISGDEHAMWFGMGDYLDLILSQDSKRFDPTTVASWIPLEKIWDAPKLQADWFLDVTRPIWDKCVGLLEGNHEQEIHKRHSFNASGYIAGAMEPIAPFLGYSAHGILRFRKHYQNSEKGGFQSKSLKLYAHHGHGGGRKPGGKVNKIDDKRRSYNADIFLMGHVHDTIMRPVVQMDLEVKRGGKKPRSIAREQWTIVTPTFLLGLKQGTTTYSEYQGYDPSWVGGTFLEIQPWGKGRKRDFEYHIHSVTL